MEVCCYYLRQTVLSCSVAYQSVPVREKGAYDSVFSLPNQQERTGNVGLNLLAEHGKMFHV